MLLSDVSPWWLFSATKRCILAEPPSSLAAIINLYLPASLMVATHHYSPAKTSRDEHVSALRGVNGVSRRLWLVRSRKKAVMDSPLNQSEPSIQRPRLPSASVCRLWCWNNIFVTRIRILQKYMKSLFAKTDNSNVQKSCLHYVIVFLFNCSLRLIGMHNEKNMIFENCLKRSYLFLQMNSSYSVTSF